jgi:protein involved in polysaccharide export with SLBB domain
MNALRFVAALALICTSPLFASEPPGGEKKAEAKYVIVPLDLVQIEKLKVFPNPPYRAEFGDVLQIRANALPDQPIDNYFIVEADGAVSFGPAYGSVHVSGMTIDEILDGRSRFGEFFSADFDHTVLP